MRILYVSQYYPPEMGAPAARVSELARAWAAAGADVTVLTGFPNHPTGVVPPAYRGQLWRRETDAGVRLVRAPIYAAANKALIKRSLNYASFAASAAAFGPLLVEQRPDVVLATSPQFLVGVAGYWLAKLYRRPFVLEVRDLWPRSIVEVGALKDGSAPVRALEQVERFLYAHADRVVAVTDAFVDHIAAHGAARERISVVKNGVDLELFSPQPRDNAARRRLGLGERDTLVTYIGTHGLAHGLDTLLDCAKALAARGRADVRFLLVGEGAEKARLRARVAAESLSNVTMLDQRPRDEVAELLAASDLCAVLLKDKPLFRSVLPSKIFECLGAGRPVLLGVDGEARALVEEAGAGVFVPPEDAAALAAAVETLAADRPRREAMGRAGRAFVERRFSRTALAHDYLELLAKVANKPGAALAHGTEAAA